MELSDIDMSKIKEKLLSTYNAIATHRYTHTVIRYLFNCTSYADVSAAAATKRLLIIITYMFLLFVGIAVCVPSIELDWSFREGKPMTMMSVLLLFAIGHFCLRIKDYVRKENQLASVWHVLGISFIFLGFDDWLRIHETLDHTIHKIFRIHETEFTDHLDDAIVGLYAIIVLIIIWRGRRELWRYAGTSLLYFIPGALLAGGHIFMDFFVNSRSVLNRFISDPANIGQAIKWLEIVEECCKLYAEIFLLAVILRCFMLERDRRRSS